MAGAQDFISFEPDSESDHLDTEKKKKPSLSLTKLNGPWTTGKEYKQPSIMLRLHEELVDFYNYMRGTRSEHETRLDVVEKIRDLATSVWPYSQTYPYGSLKTDLYLPYSDVDIVILNVKEEENPVEKLANELSMRGLVSQVEAIPSAKIPIVKCTDKQTNIKMDICFGVTAGLETAELVQAYLAKWPIMRPLILFLKYFLQWRGLNDTYMGGVGSFVLQMMVVSMIQLHPARHLQKWSDVDRDFTLGAWLVSFFELYGVNFNYNVVGISVSGRGSYYRKKDKGRFDMGRPYLLSIENPLDKNTDIGKNSFAIMRIRKAFSYAHSQLLLRDSEEEENPVSLLSRIVGVREENLLNRRRENEKLI